MAVSYYYPSPEINVGRGFLGEYLTGFVGQRKEDHKNMIARKLKALDPTKLIELENQTLRNIGKLQEQIARIAREGYAAQARYTIAKIKAEGAIRVQEIAAQSRLRKGDRDLIGEIYGTIYDQYGQRIKNDKPDEADLRQLTQGLDGLRRPATGANYIPNIEAAFKRAGANVAKKEWLVIMALQQARSRGHKTAYSDIVNKYKGAYSSIGAPDPWLAFLGKNPELDPMTLAEKILARHKAPVGVRNIIKNEIKGDRGKLGGMPGPPTGGIQMLRGYLAQERAELADVRTQRKEMQKEYYKTALSSYMTPWLAPSYTKAPKWEADFERVGLAGARDPAAYHEYTELAYDPEYRGLLGRPKVEAIESKLRGPPIQPTPLSTQFTAPGTKEGLDELRRKVDEYQQLVRRDGQGRPAPAAKMYEIYQMAKGSEAMPGHVEKQIQELQAKIRTEQAKGRNADGDEIIKIQEAIKTMDLPQYRYGETGAAIQRIFDNAAQTGDWQGVHTDVIKTMDRGLQDLTTMREFVWREGDQARLKELKEQQQQPGVAWPFRNPTKKEIDRLRAMSVAELRDWHNKQIALHRSLDGSQEAVLAKRKMKTLMEFVWAGQGRGNDLLTLATAKEKRAALQAQAKGVPEFTPAQARRLERLKGRIEKLTAERDALKIPPAGPKHPATPPQEHDPGHGKYKSILGKLRELAEARKQIQAPQRQALAAREALDHKIRQADDDISKIKVGDPTELWAPPPVDPTLPEAP